MGRKLQRELNILVVEDEPLTRATLATFLTNEGHAVRQASCVASCRAALSSQPADLVLLDLGLPDAQGLDLARELREERGCAVIVVTQRTEIDTRIAALDHGADDYLTKPVHLGELAARIRSVARRASSGGSRFSLGHIVVDPGARIVLSRGEPVPVTRGEFELLLRLVEAGGKIVSREALSDAVTRGDGDLRSVDALISRLRRKLQSEASDALIATAPGFGYRLNVPVEKS